MLLNILGIYSAVLILLLCGVGLKSGNKDGIGGAFLLLPVLAYIVLELIK